MPTDERRRDDIAAAIAAYNRADYETVPPSAVRLLAVMFPRDDVCQRSVGDLEAVRHLLRALVDAGFLFKERGGGVANTYRLHLPRRRQA